VGRSGSPDPLDYRPLIVHFDGSSWTEVPSPQIVEGTLGSISAVSPTDIWAAGMEIGTFRTVIEHYDGTTWTAVDHPSPHSAYVNFGALDSVASDDVWLVGSYLDANSVSRTLAEHWDGSFWQVVPTPNVGTRGTSLSAVTAISSNDVWASGRTTIGDVRTGALIEHWDGNTWEAIPPERAGKSSAFGGIGSASNADIWAVGSWSNSPDGGLRTLVEHSSGTAFIKVTTPNVNDLDNVLLSVSSSPDGFVWAVGFHQEPGTNETLTMRICP
jgi:hypothetical protein